MIEKRSGLGAKVCKADATKLELTEERLRRLRDLGNGALDFIQVPIREGAQFLAAYYDPGISSVVMMHHAEISRPVEMHHFMLVPAHHVFPCPEGADLKAIGAVICGPIIFNLYEVFDAKADPAINAN